MLLCLSCQRVLPIEQRDLWLICDLDCVELVAVKGFMDHCKVQQPLSAAPPVFSERIPYAPIFRPPLAVIVRCRFFSANPCFCDKSVVAYISSLNSTPPFRRISRPKNHGKRTLENPQTTDIIGFFRVVAIIPYGHPDEPL